MTPESSITEIKGIGDKTAALFKKLNVNTVNELLHTYPRNYLSYGETIPINETKIGERQAVFAMVSSYVDVRKVRGLSLTNFTIKDGSGTMKLTWFNQPYLRNVFKKGETYVFVGTVEKRNGAKCMIVPEYYHPGDYQEMRQELQPIYPLTKGLSNNMFKKAIISCRDMLNCIEDYLPAEILRENGLMELSEAYENMHFPMNETLLKNAIRRIAFDEFYTFLYDMNELKEHNNKQNNAHKVVEGKLLSEFIENLPYRLTKGQSLAIDDILKDMGSDFVMNRLIQGDVGSGKTIVAFCALYATVKAGYQGAMMAPTEVLARQHFQEVKKQLGVYGVRCACLTGSSTMKEKRQILEGLKEGSIDIIIGTHAVIEDNVSFKDLGLVVTDEQHRFGVSQREKLGSKGNCPHVLVMSATPIPRTLAIVLYADMDISVIKELPKGRKPIKNCVVGTEYRKTAYEFIKKQVAEGSQVYIICPMVEESETMDLTNVTEYVETMKSVLPQDICVAMLHGQMKSEEKNNTMKDFIDGKIHVLVSTTVIEVGINNPNATVMMVENSERFGLAQLHQLRGRVGRGNKQSYCIFINAKESEESNERLKVLENSNDGFFIAGEDLKLRGPGDFFGIRQSGEAMFVLADIYNHADMLKLAQDILKKYGTIYKPGKDIDAFKSRNGAVL